MTKASYKRFFSGLSPEQYVEYALCNLEKAGNRVRQFHKNYQTYLATQRNLLIDEILESLKKPRKKRQEGIFYRVVSSKYILYVLLPKILL